MQVKRVASMPDELVLFFRELPLIDNNLPPEQVASLRARIEQYRAYSARLLTDGVAAGEFRPLDASAVHYSIVGILAYIPIWFRPSAGRSASDLVDELADFVLSGVAVRDEAGVSDDLGDNGTATADPARPGRKERAHRSQGKGTR